MSESVEAIHYHYRGPVEVGHEYDWCDGYSADGPNGGVLYPWQTKRACRADAKAQGKRALFFRNGRRER